MPVWAVMSARATMAAGPARAAGSVKSAGPVRPAGTARSRGARRGGRLGRLVIWRYVVTGVGRRWPGRSLGRLRPGRRLRRRTRRPWLSLRARWLRLRLSRRPLRRGLRRAGGRLAVRRVLTGGTVLASGPGAREIGPAFQADQIPGLEGGPTCWTGHGRHETSPACTPARSSVELSRSMSPRRGMPM
jgi:hypothetical protein